MAEKKTNLDNDGKGQSIIYITNHINVGDNANVNTAGIAHGGMGHRAGVVNDGMGNENTNTTPSQASKDTSHIRQYIHSEKDNPENRDAAEKNFPITEETSSRRGEYHSRKESETKDTLQDKPIENITLHQACDKGCLNEVTQIVSKVREDINTKDKNGVTPVMLAARAGHGELVDFLVKKGADMTLVNNDGDNILHQACRGGDVETVEIVLAQNKLDINRRNKNGETPVMMAARAGHGELVDFLVKKGADMSIVNNDGDNILHQACKGGDMETVKKVLAQNKLDINRRSKNRETPVMMAASAGHGELVDFLVNTGADMSLVNTGGDNILHQACRVGDEETVRRVIAQSKLDINSRSKNSETPVMIAAKAGYVKLVVFLMKKRADMSLANKCGENILHQACRGGDIETVREVLAQDKLDINSSSKNGETPVMMAARAGYVELVDFLVKKGADMSLVNSGGDNILHQACRGGDIETVKTVLAQDKLDINSRSKNGETPVMMAARAGYVELVDLLVKKGGDMSLVNNSGDNILHQACRGGDEGTVKRVLAQDKVDINSRDKRGWTPVVVAALARHGELVDFLVKKGADMSSVNNSGDNILHQACSGGDVEIVKRILALEKVDINSRDQNGETPVMMAARDGHVQLVEVLVKKGADMSLVNNGGDNILHQACKGGDIETVKEVLAQDKLDINSRGKTGQTPVMKAARAGYGGLVKKGADMTLVNNDGDDILHQSCRGGDVETVKIVLAQNKLRINSRAKNGWTPVMMAARAGHRELVDFLVKKGADMSLVNNGSDNILHQACRGGDIETVKGVLAHKQLGINIRGKNGETPVMMAAMAGHGELVAFLVKKGADMSVVNICSDNILHQACRGGDIETVRRVLAQNKVDINSRGKNRETPVMMAAKAGHGELVDFLVKKGADMSLVNNVGDNILHQACKGGDVEKVQRVLEQGKVDINSRDKNGE
ncbi:ankyrin-3-like, partial [Haliotis cracherodii]|uniref:ankyrin-3-like n=1 Tax=Haliotis cracherodii TaxID=6455 RepID=UPI0039E8CD5C